MPFGIYNVTNPGPVTTHEVVELIKKSGVSNKDFQFFNDEAEFMQTAAKTPRSNCVLDCSKLARLRHRDDRSPRGGRTRAAQLEKAA